MTELTKDQLRARLQVRTDSEIAAFFGISPSAVSQWKDDQPIPELRQLQAERKRPDLFGPPDSLARRSEAAPDKGAAASAAEAPVRPVEQAA